MNGSLIFFVLVTQWFWKLYDDDASLPTVNCVLLPNSLGGCSAARKEVQYDVTVTRSNKGNTLEQPGWLWVGKRGTRTAKKLSQLLGAFISVSNLFKRPNSLGR